jgi:hypothetical protein
MTKSIPVLILAVAVFFLACGVVMFLNPVLPAYGSVNQGNEYHSTTTPYLASGTILNSTAGALGSVIVTATSTGVMYFFDATTTDVNKRTNNTPTTTLLLASFPAGVPVGTYTFDAAYNNGLIVVYTSTVPTTTVTYR